MIAFWNYFIYFAVVAVLLWAAGACAAWKDRKVVAYSATIAGLVVFFSYILIMWISLDRPPNAYHGRDTSVVFFLLAISRHHCLQSVGLQMAAVVLYHLGIGLHWD